MTVNTKLGIKQAVGLCLVAAMSVASNAAIIDVSNNNWLGGQIIDAPSMADNDDFGDDNYQYGFNEAQGVVLTEALTTTTGTIKAGKHVNSHMIFLNHASKDDTSKLWADNTWTFDGKVLGVMHDTMGLHEAASTPLLGAAGTVYPASGYGYRGMEGNDKIWVSGDTVRVFTKIKQPGDWIRVVTSVPEPATLPLFALAFAPLLMRRRRKA